MQYSAWDQVFDTAQTNSLVRELARTHLREVMGSNPYTRGVKTLVALAIYMQDYECLVNMELRYGQLSAEDAYHLRQCLAFYSKRADLDIGVDRRAAALASFDESERVCQETNTIFELWSSGGFHFLPDVNAVFHRAARKISQALGEVPMLSDIKLRFGPGATTQVKRKIASARQKLSMPYACSEDLIDDVCSVICEMPAWISPELSVGHATLVPVEIHHGRLSFVPKNAKTDRSIVVEPMLNSMVQLGIGDYIAGRLKRFGVDITDQTRNQTLAREGSIHGGLATLDLSSASDTVATELVAHLLPVDWYLFLSSFRTSNVEMGGTVYSLQKFSSMGNGFTFPLETLIFWALAKSCCTDSEIVSVYGDDIICPTHRYDLLVRVLSAAGFKVNPSKSFATGPFRESCGKDYYSGIDIRPVYVKDRLSCSELFTLHNYYFRRHGAEQCSLLRSYIHPSVILEGPDGYGDGHLLCEHSRYEQRKPNHLANGWAGYTFETYSWKSRFSFRALPGDYVYPAYCTYIRSRGNVLEKHFALDLTDEKHVWRRGVMGVTLPGRHGYKRIKIYTLG